MAYRSWIDEWNDIIRNIIFADDELKTLMEIPEGTNIIAFTDRHFIRAGYTNKTLVNEPVRIVYGMLGTGDLSPYVTQNQLSFDIYVKSEELHNVQRDRLVYRTELIACRLKELLLNQQDNGYKFHICGEGDLGTSTPGYVRYNLTLKFKKTY